MCDIWYTIFFAFLVLRNNTYLVHFVTSSGGTVPKQESLPPRRSKVDLQHGLLSAEFLCMFSPCLLCFLLFLWFPPTSLQNPKMWICYYKLALAINDGFFFCKWRCVMDQHHIWGVFLSRRKWCCLTRKKYANEYEYMNVSSFEETTNIV